MVNAMVPVAVVPVQLVPVYQVRVPVLPEEAVKVAPVVTPLLLPSSKAIGRASCRETEEPAVNTGAGEEISSYVAKTATTDSGWVPLAKAPEAMVTVGLPTTLSS